MHDKWKKAKALIKVFSLFFVVLFTLYSAVWFKVTENLRETLKKSRFETKSYSLSFNNPKVDGFPFKLRVELDNINFYYNSTLLNEVAKISLDKIITETGPLFTQMKITLPAEIIVDLNLGQIKTELKLITKGEHYLRLKDQNFINTFKLAKFLYNTDKDLGISLGKLQYFADNSTVIDRTTNKEILNSSGNIEISINSKDNGTNNISYKSNNKSTILAKENLGNYFHNIASDVSVNIETKLKSENYYIIPLVKVNNLSLKLDNMNANLTGEIKGLMSSDFNVNLNLKLNGWNEFFQEMQKQNLLSLEKQTLINDLMLATTGKPNPSDIKIYTTKDGTLNIGNLDLYLLSTYLNQIANTK